MRIRNGVFACLVTAIALGLWLGAAHAEDPAPVRAKVQAVLLADVDAVAPGGTFRVGVQFTIEKDWHVYWLNPGDAGIPTKVDLRASAATLGSWQYPEPVYFGAGTPLAGYGYENEVLLFAEAKTPASPAAKDLTFTGKASWLVCKQVCIPGSQEVSLTLPYAAAARPSTHAARFDEAKARVPVKLDAAPGFTVSHQFNATGVKPEQAFQVLFVLKAPAGATLVLRGEANHPLFAPFKPTAYEVQKIDIADTGGKPRDELAVKLTALAFPDLASGEKVGGVFQFVLHQGGKNTPMAIEFSVDVPVVGAAAAVEPIALPDLTAGVAPASSHASLALMLLFAFVGGVLLNIMPCVLPVVSIKILSLLRQSQLDRRALRHHGLAYTVGILVSFVILAGFVAGLKSGGEAIGWGFQFQSPLFVGLLAGVVFVFGLSLLDVFVIVAPGSATLHEVAGARGVRGSFFNGVFATILATPCTAPFLGTAIGFAFSQPLAVTFLMFVAVGVGLAFPFLLLAYVPAWTRFMPKPGHWMDTFKSLMGFLLLATTIWLLDVLGQQVGARGLTQMLIYLGLLGFAAWLFGRFGNVQRRARVRYAATLAAAILVLGGGAWLLRFSPPAATAGNAAIASSGGIAWQPFSDEKVKQLGAEGKTVFLDFTAAWCWTCKVNEQAVIETDKVAATIRELGVVALKGDWTNRDPAISAFLARHGKAGVPVYAVLGPGTNGEIVLLPEVITKDMVIDALRKAAHKT
jgi:thiol:disulfide interchange protein DsbD